MWHILRSKILTAADLESIFLTAEVFRADDWRVATWLDCRLKVLWRSLAGQDSSRRRAFGGQKNSCSAQAAGSASLRPHYVSLMWHLRFLCVCGGSLSYLRSARNLYARDPTIFELLSLSCLGCLCLICFANCFCLLLSSSTVTWLF